MSRTDLTEDGAVLLATLTSPDRGLAAAAGRGRSLTALLAATLASLLVALVVLPRLDFSAGAEAAAAAAADGQPPTQHQVEEAVLQASKVGAVAGWASAGLGPALAALGVALACWLAFRVAGTRPGFRPTLAVAAHALLPVALAKLLLLPAVVARAPLPAADLAGLLPTSLASLLPAQSAPLVAALAASLDLFAAWSVVLLVLGMARVAGASRLRAGAVVALLWIGWIVAARLLPASMAAGRGGGA